MRLTVYSDYTLRVLIYLGMNPSGRSTIADIATAYGVSRNHLMKVVHHLARRGDITSQRGRGGGIRLARPPESISVGAIVRATERDSTLVECFARRGSACRIEAACALKGMFGGAAEAFYAELDAFTLADLLRTEQRMSRLLATATVRPPAGPARAPGLPAAAGWRPGSRRPPAQSVRRGTSTERPRRPRKS